MELETGWREEGYLGTGGGMATGQDTRLGLGSYCRF